MVTNNYSVVVKKYKNGIPTEYGVEFKNGNHFSAVFDSEEIANLAAQFYVLVNYNMDLWMRLFPPTLRMWGIKDIWGEF